MQSIDAESERAETPAFEQSDGRLRGANQERPAHDVIALWSLLSPLRLDLLHLACAFHECARPSAEELRFFSCYPVFDPCMPEPSPKKH